MIAAPSFAAARQNVLEFVHEKLARDSSIDEPRRQSLEAALRERFGSYGFNVVRPARMEDVHTLLHVINEGILDEQSSARIADVGFAAYQAIWRGAPAEAVDGIALYGFQRQLPADTLSTWANGYRDGTQSGVSPDVMAGVVHAAMKNGWSDSTFNAVKWAVVGAAKRGWDVNVYAAHLLSRLEREGGHPGAVEAELRVTFEEASAQHRKVAPPADYDAVFRAEPAPAPIVRKQVKREESKIVERAQPPVDDERPVIPDPRAEPARAEAGETSGFWPSLREAARSYLGTPYVWGGVTHRGIDCSGFTMASYRDGPRWSLPRVSKEQWRIGLPVMREDLRDGDLVFFNTEGNGVSHVGLIVDSRRRRLMHASVSKGVVEADFDGRWFQTRYLGARRVAR